jgi:hypothetical protein
MGLPFSAPLGHLREYLRICKALLQQGRWILRAPTTKAHDTIAQPLDVPVMASALQRDSFELCGEETDGRHQLGVSWAILARGRHCPPCAPVPSVPVVRCRR